MVPPKCMDVIGYWCFVSSLIPLWVKPKISLGHLNSWEMVATGEIHMFCGWDISTRG